MGTEAVESPARATILVIDDEGSLRQLLTSILTHEGHRVLAAEDADQAAEILGDDSLKIDLALVDILLPGLSGPELVQEIREQRPELKVIFMSGSQQPRVLETVHLVKNDYFLQKPSTQEQILATVREALAASPG